MNSRWWIYQRERFPFLAHGPMVIVFCLSAMLFSSLQVAELPAPYRVAGAIVSAFIFFFQLRVADEFKDFEVDSRYRPHRPVPRGLVRLNELARLAWIGAAVQFAVAVSIDIGLVPLLIISWGYLGLMTREFFVAGWLKRRPAIYLLSHMLVMPLIAFYVSAFDWLCECRAVPDGMGWFLLFSFGCGLVLELGRKIRLPAAEREGVETYSGLWGGVVAIGVWTTSVSIAAVAYSIAAAHITTNRVYLIPAVMALLLASLVAVLYRSRRGSAAGARFIEPGSGLVAMLLYLGLGPLQAFLA